MAFSERLRSFFSGREGAKKESGPLAALPESERLRVATELEELAKQQYYFLFRKGISTFDGYVADRSVQMKKALSDESVILDSHLFDGFCLKNRELLGAVSKEELQKVFEGFLHKCFDQQGADEDEGLRRKIGDASHDFHEGQVTETFEVKPAEKNEE